MRHRTFTGDPLDRKRYPINEWALTETRFVPDEVGTAETLFGVGNGYLGLRGNLEEGNVADSHGTFCAGFHETWQIQHAEDAYGFARVGQGIVNVPDAKAIRLSVDGEPFDLPTVDVVDYSRRLDFADGALYRTVVWRTKAGKRVTVRSTRMVSFTRRNLALMTYEVTVDADASVVIVSELRNRAVGDNTADGELDPRRQQAMTGRTLHPVEQRDIGGRSVLSFVTTRSKMAVTAGVDHTIDTNEYDHTVTVGPDLARHEFRIAARAGAPVMLTKAAAWFTSGVEGKNDLPDRCEEALDHSLVLGAEALLAEQRDWLDEFWARSDVEVGSQPAVQQAVRFSLFQLAQASARAESDGIAAKGCTGSGYSGHTFWDTETYVVPFLTYTNPHMARSALGFRHAMLDTARQRAGELALRGALFPWRTINGYEASAYYAAGTAQFHIDADIAHALSQYVRATGDQEFLHRQGVDILVETARMWASLGFWRDGTFHIHGVTGPDEYTAVVDDNLYTNVMAAANLRYAVEVVEQMRRDHTGLHAAATARLGLSDIEVREWTRIADAVAVHVDSDLGVHAQDSQFLSRAEWDFDGTPDEKYPLLLNFHPLVIYRHQVLKQADAVLAMFLQGHRFTAAEKRANFDYYDPRTTGDSTLSAAAQSIIAAEVGHADLALKYFHSSVFTDLADIHRNTRDGVHVASAGGVWSSLVYGFGGMRDHEGQVQINPHLPDSWGHLTYRVTIKGSRVRVRVTGTYVELSLESEVGPVEVTVRGWEVVVRPGEPVRLDVAETAPALPVAA